ncbi:Molybdopterin molybdenumtransferase [Urbifossiella limnaea]|uniref:Molybdopterin molybdenumtransferase n=2 Tax=Urbifossiella limnaea TaxID=2528023 RepID=A0A517XNZ1_9BACT|nr:Molybdopterin molybdenumtransferase [Urbifossiella limnaea]
MLEVADALAEVLARARPRSPQLMPLEPGNVGGVLAEDVTADRDAPPFDKSLRDGYAVRSTDRFDAELCVVEEIPAGVVPRKAIGPGECARIYTGAPIPAGADAVVMQEDTTAAGDRVRINAAPRPGAWVFRRGAEMRTGEVVVAAGTILTPAAIGVLVGVGRARIETHRFLDVGVVATGDELVGASEAPGPGQIRNTNGPMLTALACQAGTHGCDNGIARDTRESLRAVIGPALDNNNVVLIAGGVSAGKFDLVPGVLAELGVTAHFHQVRMKPGKPLLFGTRGDTLVFGLPGNPVSALVCFELFVRPALRKMAGHADPGPRVVNLPLAAAVVESNDRPTYRPAKLEPAAVGWAVRPLDGGTAPDLRGMAPADALLALPAGDARYDAGTPVRVVLIGKQD